MTNLYLRKNEVLPTSETIWEIRSGQIRSQVHNSSGETIVTGFWKEGEIVGHPLACDRGYNEIISIDGAELAPITLNSLFSPLISRIQVSDRLLAIVGRTNTSDRLWDFLAFMDERFGRQVTFKLGGAIAKGSLIDIKLPHEQIAQALNTSRGTVTNFITKFEKAGKLLRRERKLILLNEQEEIPALSARRRSLG